LVRGVAWRALGWLLMRPSTRARFVCMTSDFSNGRFEMFFK
jgi:hypothetical protein